MLSKRLQTLADCVGEHYAHIWDCCCDHGLLGQALLQQRAAQVHFVDNQAHLIEALQARLASLSMDPARWHLHCEDVHTLGLARDARTQLVVIAGVGGASTAQMLRALLQRHPHAALDFLLCPLRQVEHVRAQAAELGMGLVQEHCIEERGRCYQVVLLSTAAKRAVSLVGEDFWRPSEPAQRRYLAERIRYLSTPGGGGSETAQRALVCYHELWARFENEPSNGC